MHYAILASYAEGVVESWGGEEDKTQMDELRATHERMVATKHFRPAARLVATEDAKPAERFTKTSPVAPTC
ncbi:MAG: hypothetical protein Rhirs2KO_21650 [Rhizobiaceae bacterium]